MYKCIVKLFDCDKERGGSESRYRRTPENPARGPIFPRALEVRTTLGLGLDFGTDEDRTSDKVDHLVRTLIGHKLIYIIFLSSPTHVGRVLQALLTLI